MGNETERFPLLRLTEKGRSSIEDVVAREFPLTVIASPFHWASVQVRALPIFSC